MAQAGSTADASVTIKPQGEITPFWNRIPKFFLYPFHLGPLLYLLGLSAGSLLFLGMLFMPGIVKIIGIFVELGILLAGMRYAFHIMEQTSLGYLTPEQHEVEQREGRSSLPWKLFGIMLVLGFAIGVAARVSPKLGLAATLLVNFALPAIVMSLSVSNSLFGALNPGAWITIIRTVGKPYFALWIFLFLLSGGGPMVIAMILPKISPWLILPVAHFVSFYFTFVMFNMMGYCLYQYHHMLGIGVKVDFDRANDGSGPAKGAKPSDPVGDEIAAKLAAGDLKGAHQLAYDQHRALPDDVNAQERYFKILQLGDKPETTLRQGLELIGLLLRKGRGDRALDVFKTCRKTKPEFAPENPGDLFRLAQAARKARDPMLALALVRGFDKNNPRHPDVPAVMLMSAQILSENLKKDDLATGVLKGLLQKFPDHALAAEATAYLKAIERMAALKTAPKT